MSPSISRGSFQIVEQQLGHDAARTEQTQSHGVKHEVLTTGAAFSLSSCCITLQFVTFYLFIYINLLKCPTA